MLIRAGNPSLWTGRTGTNTYLLLGPSPALIDAGVGRPAHVAAVEEALQGRPLETVLITHAHPDHVGGLPSLVERWPAAAIRNDAGRPCVDGELIAAGSTRLRAVHTPGHAPDHFSFFDETRGDLYCGDLARLGGTIVVPASRGGSLTQYLASLRRVRSLEPRRLRPGHGPVVVDPAALIDSYLHHRQERERQVVEALGDGCRSVAQIVARVYGAMPAALAGAAAESVLAHLVKLADEGRAREAGDEWRLT